MVDVYRTDEEQVDALKRWWKENGNATLISIGAALLLYFGWQSWESNRETRTAEASAIYQQLLGAADRLVTQPDDELYGKAGSMVEVLKTEYPGTVYSHYAALISARLLVEQGEYAEAAEELTALLAAEPPPQIATVARLRLGRVQLQLGQMDAALATANSVTTGPFAAGFAELAGDVHAAAGDIDAARTAYQRARELTAPEEAGVLQVLDIKMNGLVAPAPKGEVAQ